VPTEFLVGTGYSRPRNVQRVYQGAGCHAAGYCRGRPQRGRRARNFRANVQNVRGECPWSRHERGSPRCMKMGLVAHQLFVNIDVRAHRSRLPLMCKNDCFLCIRQISVRATLSTFMERLASSLQATRPYVSTTLCCAGCHAQVPCHAVAGPSNGSRATAIPTPTSFNLEGSRPAALCRPPEIAFMRITPSSGASPLSRRGARIAEKCTSTTRGGHQRNPRPRMCSRPVAFIGHLSRLMDDPLARSAGGYSLKRLFNMASMVL
jgi:hypothetical protein